jgi:DNA mismatch repair protein MutS
VPRPLIRRAGEILAELEQGVGTNESRKRRQAMATPVPSNGALQLILFAPPNPAVSALRALDVESLSPLEALQKLYELKHMAVDEEPPGT